MNNYRFYGEKQIVRANHIQVLKRLGFGLNEISEILMDDMLDDRLKTFLESKIKEKKEMPKWLRKQAVYATEGAIAVPNIQQAGHNGMHCRNMEIWGLFV